MSYKMNKTEIKGLSTVEVIKHFESCIEQGVKEANSMRGLTKTTIKSRELLLNELLDRVGSDETYDSNYKIIKR